MNEADFVHSIRHSYHSIRHSYDLFDDLGRIRLFRQPTSLPSHSNFNAVALDVTAPYSEVFMCGLRLGHYNLQLHDFSYFQFSRIDHDELRFAFYPSPFGPNEFSLIDKLTTLLNNEQLDFESYSYFLGTIGTNARRPLVRYEFSRTQYVRGRHPAAHFHFGTYGEDRWTVKLKLSPYAFSLMIAKLYFSEDWEVVTTESKHGGERQNEFDAKYVAAKAACTVTAPELFGPMEERQLHFA